MSSGQRGPRDPSGSALARGSEATAGDTAMAPLRCRRPCPAVGFLFLAKFCPTPSLLLLASCSLRVPTVCARPELSLWVPWRDSLDQVAVPTDRGGGEESQGGGRTANQAEAAGGGAGPGRGQLPGDGLPCSCPGGAVGATLGGAAGVTWTGREHKLWSQGDLGGAAPGRAATVWRGREGRRSKGHKKDPGLS